MGKGVARGLRDLFFSFGNVLERNPARAFAFLLVTHLGFFWVLNSVTSKWPSNDLILAQVVLWIWLGWMIYLGVPTLKYMYKKHMEKNTGKKSNGRVRGRK